MTTNPETAVLEPEADIADPVRLPAFSEGIQNAPVLTDAATAFLPVSLADIRSVAEMLAALPGNRSEFRDPKACEAITLQAALWRVSPLFVLQCAYQAKQGGPIGYEAKLLHAVILANGPLSRRPRLQYGWSDPNKKTVGNRFCRAIFWVHGEDEPIVVTSPTVSQIKVKNSPEWFSNTDQQLGYYTFRAGARLHFPDVLGGAYTREEVIYMRSVEPGGRAPMFPASTPEVIDAEFDGSPPTGQDEANFTKWLERASGKQSSNDPRDDPQNQGPGEPGGEPDDAHAIRTWAAAEQKRMLDLKTSGELRAAMESFLQDKRSRRLKTYQRPLYDALMQAIGKRGERLTADEEAAK